MTLLIDRFGEILQVRSASHLAGRFLKGFVTATILLVNEIKKMLHHSKNKTPVLGNIPVLGTKLKRVQGVFW